MSPTQKPGPHRGIIVRKLAELRAKRIEERAEGLADILLALADEISVRAMTGTQQKAADDLAEAIYNVNLDDTAALDKLSGGFGPALAAILSSGPTGMKTPTAH